MRLLDRYIARECLKVLILGLTLFVGVYLIVDLFEKFSRFLEAHVAPGLIFRYYLFSLPAIIIQVLPVAVLIATLIGMGTLARNNEILAMKMGQVSTLRIALPAILLGAVASLAAWGTAEYVAAAASERALNIWRTQVRRLPAHQITRDSDIWYRAQNDRFVHIALMDPRSGVIRGMSIFELSPGFDLLRRVDAQEATWASDGWTLRKGYLVDLTRTPPQVQPFAKMQTPLPERPEEFARVARSPEEMNYSQLHRYIQRLASSGVNVSRYRVDLQAKIATALISFIMGIIGVSFGLRTGKAGVMLWVGACIPIGFAYWMLLSLGFALGRGGALPPLVAAWLPNIVFGAGGLASLWRLRG